MHRHLNIYHHLMHDDWAWRGHSAVQGDGWHSAAKQLQECYLIIMYIYMYVCMDDRFLCVRESLQVRGHINEHPY